MNPLLPADFHGSGVHAVPETEDFIASIGHLATEDEILHLQSEVELSEKDFVDPTLVFEDRGGRRADGGPCVVCMAATRSAAGSWGCHEGRSSP